MPEFSSRHPDPEHPIGHLESAKTHLIDISLIMRYVSLKTDSTGPDVCDFRKPRGKLVGSATLGRRRW